MNITQNSKVTWEGPIIFIGFGSISRATLPLLLRHIDCNPKQISIIDPDDVSSEVAHKYGANFIKQAVTVENYQKLLGNIISQSVSQSLLMLLQTFVQKTLLNLRLKQIHFMPILL